MNRNGFLFAIALIVSAGSAWAQETLSEDSLAAALMPENPQTVISIASEPAGCWVQIDSVTVGKTPLNNFAVTPGEHFVSIFPPNTGVWNLKERRTNIIVNEGENRWIRVDFDTPVKINSLPYGAMVYQDTSAIGTTPLQLAFERNKGKTFQIRKSGYHPFIFTLSARQAILAELEEDNDYVEANEKPQFLGIFPRERVKSKFTLLALTVAAQWGAFYLKNAADNNFEKYRETADPALQKKYWDNTQKFDRLSEITLGTSYVSLAALIYLVVRH